MPNSCVPAVLGCWSAGSAVPVAFSCVPVTVSLDAVPSFGKFGSSSQNETSLSVVPVGVATSRIVWPCVSVGVPPLALFGVTV